MTESVSITLKWWTATTVLTVIHSLTFCSRSTGLSSAQWYTFLGGIVTFLSFTAVSVLETANFNATDYRIALKTLRTEALRHMVVDLALCSASTRDASTGVNTLL